MHMSVGVIILILVLLLAANIYVGLRYFKLINIAKRKWVVYLYWILHIFFEIIFVINFIMFFNGWQYGTAAAIIRYMSAFFVGTGLYSVVIFLIRDFFISMSKHIYFPDFLNNAGTFLCRYGIAVMALAMGITLYGMINSKIYRVKEYGVTISKEKAAPGELDAVFISDAHMGCSLGTDELKHIVGKINGLNPDIVFLGGDIFDDGTEDIIKEEASEILSDITAEHGVYYILGNHECYLEDVKAQEQYFRDAGITVLNDQSVLIDNQFYLVGRVDKEGDRQPLSEAMKDVDADEYPVIVLDHEPVFKQMEEAAEAGADLQLSGHTHAGQIFPTHILNATKICPFYGYFKTDGLQTLVSSGVGTWGVPLRIGSNCEIVNVSITFE